MKNSILFLVFFCFAFVAKGQNYGFSDPSVKKKRIKSILVKVYENKVNRFNHKFYNYKRYFDTSGILTKEIVYHSNQDTSENNYFYSRKENIQILKILSKKRRNLVDSITMSTKNDSILEIKDYARGKLLFYNQIVFGKQKHITKDIQISYSPLSKNISPTLRFYNYTERDTSVHTKIIHIDSSQAYVKEYFNNNKSNYSEGYIYYNKDRLIEKKVIRDFYPNVNESVNSVELRFYDNRRNLTKVYRLFEEDFKKLQKDPNAKVFLIDSDEYKYNERNMLIEHTTFSENVQIGFKNPTNRKIAANITRKMSKLVITYGYEYW